MVSSMVLRPQSPVNVWKDGLIFIVDCPKDAAAYVWSLLALSTHVSEKRDLSIFSTNLTQNHGIFNTITVKPPTLLRTKFLPAFSLTIDPPVYYMLLICF